jgi:hypothetical protein
MDSILVNGRGVVECPPRGEMEAVIEPGLVPFMKANGLRITDKGYGPNMFSEA